MNKSKVRRISALALLAAMLAAAGCQRPVEPETAPPEPAEEMPAQSEPQEEKPAAPAFTAPLTGLGIEEEAKERPIAVMINNFSAARPQSGLSHADMIWEILAEGGITRLVAIFQSESFDEPIGPIRSIRPYLIEIGESYRAVLAHAGGSTDAYAILQNKQAGKAYLDEITNAGSYFWRDSSRKAPHNLYSNLEKLREGADKKGYKADKRPPMFYFEELSQKAAADAESSSVTEGGAGTAGSADNAGSTDTAGSTETAPATSVDIRFLLKDYVVSYAYDAQEGVYKRSINGKPHIDLNTGEALEAANLVVLGADHQVYDNVGRLKINLDKGGEALLIRGGEAVRARWERLDGVIRIMKDGAELPFAPGKTFYHIVPNSPSFAEHVTLG
ncbi:DUF3048 domain-containing protein [Paenibacillus cisolokensis]|uniref:DUF3048 domain-containing protein n=1 Tax=Paenibacillus cisolokensis TaxID=1658519 RepID=UPI003D2985B1